MDHFFSGVLNQLTLQLISSLLFLRKPPKQLIYFSKTIKMSLLTVFHTFLFTIFQAWMYNIHHHHLIDYYLRAVGSSENPSSNIGGMIYPRCLK